ncbi:MAG: dTDP-4-amino-4,6-dideoxygalactose transaminase [Balneolales bacterium]|nr:dTDP-4-amino-4,6-dideoxygalactose transaminase [Balneolales bacterium]
MIPFHKPYTDEREANALYDTLKSGVLRGDGLASKSVQKLISDITGAKYVYFTTSCTHALEIAILSLNLKPGDEVIMPSFTFVSTANAVLLHGGKPVFCDIHPDTLNIAPDDIRSKISSRTRAIIPVHYAGVSAEMDAICALANEYNLQVIEDAAQGADAYYNNRHLGSIGDMGCLSFHDTKNITCGEGGAFLTNSEEIARKAEVIREKGTNRSAFLRGEVDKYTWIERGSSFIQSDLLAAMLNIQWQKKDEIRRLRKNIWETYHAALEAFELAGYLQRPVIPKQCTSNYHTYFFTVNSPADQDNLLQLFRSHGISASFHYIPLHTSPFGLQINPTPPSLPVTEKISNCLIRLPIYPGLLDEHPDFCTLALHVLSEYYSI